MLRLIFWFSVWALTLGLLDIDVEYKDGLRIKLHSWLRRNKAREGKG